MGVMGSLPTTLQLSHLLIGPQQYLVSQELNQEDGSTGSWHIKSRRTTFTWPFRSSDRISKSGGVKERPPYWPIGLGNEDDIHIRPMAEGVAQPIFDNLELYLINKKGDFLKKIGNDVYTLTPKRNDAGRPLRGGDGKLQFGPQQKVDSDSPLAKARGVVYVKPRLQDRFNSFVLHKRFIVNPRIVVGTLMSGLFDSGIYYIGKAIGKREDIAKKMLNITPNHLHEDKVLASNFLPVPITSPQTVITDMKQSAQEDDPTEERPSLTGSGSNSSTNQPAASRPATPAPAGSPVAGLQNTCFITSFNAM